MGKRRDHAQVERDRKRIGELYLKGQLQAEIAEELGIDQSTVSRDLKALFEQWRQSALVDINEAKSRELAKINALELTYWSAWERSCENAETLQQVGGKDGPARITKTSKGQAGDPRFLQGVQWCIERRCKILGIDAPDKLQHSGRIETETHVTFTNAERAERVMALLDAARARRDTGSS